MGPLKRSAQNDTAVDGKVLWARGAVHCRGGVRGLLSRVPKGEAPGAPGQRSEIRDQRSVGQWLGCGACYPTLSRRLRAKEWGTRSVVAGMRGLLPHPFAQTARERMGHPIGCGWDAGLGLASRGFGHTDSNAHFPAE
jgi:hypothetical protein